MPEIKDTPVLRCEHLSYIYSQGTPFEKGAIQDVNLEIARGEFVGIIGHTGSGKSTLIQHFNGLLRPTLGRIYIDGHDLWSDKSKLREYRFKVGLVFQYPEYQLFEETVYKDIAFGPINMGLPEAEIHERVVEAARFVGLREEQFERSPFELSGGQKRRVAIAGVLAMRPEVLILDEPTAGLDPKGREQILGQIREYHQQEKNTVMLVSHSMEDVARFAKKVLVINQSRIFMYDDVEKVFAHAREITEMGLSVPQVTRVFSLLRQRGYPVREDVYTLEQAVEQIQTLTKGGRG